MIADMISNKKLSPIDEKSTVFIAQSYFQVPKDFRLHCTHLFIMKIPNKGRLQEIAFNHLSVIDFNDFMNSYKKCTAKLYSFLMIDTTLALNNTLSFRKNLLERIQKPAMTIDDKIRDENCNMILTESCKNISIIIQKN